MVSGLGTSDKDQRIQFHNDAQRVDVANENIAEKLSYLGKAGGGGDDDGDIDDDDNELMMWMWYHSIQ